MLMAPVSLSPVLWADWKCWELTFPGATLSQQGTGVVNTDLSFTVPQGDSSEVCFAPVVHSGNSLIYTVLNGFLSVITPLSVF